MTPQPPPINSVADLGSTLRSSPLSNSTRMRAVPSCEESSIYDFMYLFVDFGQDFAEEAARRYGHRDLERLISKLLYFGLVDQIGAILDGKGLALKLSHRHSPCSVNAAQK